VKPLPYIGRTWWLVVAAVVLFLIGFPLEFTGKDGNSLPGAILVVIGFMCLSTFWIILLRRRRASH
jgi:hypothetical protein